MIYIWLYIVVAVYSISLYVNALDGVPDSEIPQKMLDAVNKFRKENGKPELALSQALIDAAQSHTNYQVEIQTMTHEGAGDDKSMGDRINKSSNGKYGFCAENVAKGQTSIESVMEAWINSEGHRNNLLGDYMCFGIGYKFSEKEKSHYWTQTFGRGIDRQPCDPPKNQAPPPPPPSPTPEPKQPPPPPPSPKPEPKQPTPPPPAPTTDSPKPTTTVSNPPAGTKSKEAKSEGNKGPEIIHIDPSPNLPNPFAKGDKGQQKNGGFKGRGRHMKRHGQNESGGDNNNGGFQDWLRSWMGGSKDTNSPSGGYMRKREEPDIPNPTPSQSPTSPSSEGGQTYQINGGQYTVLPSTDPMQSLSEGPEVYTAEDTYTYTPSTGNAYDPGSVHTQSYN